MKPAGQQPRKDGTYFVTSVTAGRIPFFRYERWGRLFLDTLQHYRREEYSLHEFVLMPDHFHLILTPAHTLERAVQMIKGEFSRQAAVQFETKEQIWQRGFTDHRLRDSADYQHHRRYIHENPVKSRLSASAQEYRYSSAWRQRALDPIPQGLKPLSQIDSSGTAEAVPFPYPPVTTKEFEGAEKKELT